MGTKVTLQGAPCIPYQTYAQCMYVCARTAAGALYSYCMHYGLSHEIVGHTVRIHIVCEVHMHIYAEDMLLSWHRDAQKGKTVRPHSEKGI